MLVSYEFLLRPNMCRVVGWGGHGLDVCIKPKQRIVLVSRKRIVVVYILNH